MIEFGIKEPMVQYTERPGSYGITIKNDLVLLVKNPGGYFLPGGGIETNELPDAALKREYLEEIGVKITAFQKIGEATQYLHVPSVNVYIKKIGYFYLAELDNKISQLSEDDHLPEWVTFEFAVKNLYREFQVWAVQEAFKLPRLKGVKQAAFIS